MTYDLEHSPITVCLLTVLLGACNLEAEGNDMSESLSAASSEGKPMHYDTPNLGFAGCTDKFVEFYTLDDGSSKVAIAIPQLGACEEGPFSEFLGVYIKETAGWRLFFSGDYNPPVNAVGRGGKNRRLSMTSRNTDPRLTFQSRDGHVVLVTDDGREAATSAEN